jgi:hypothetical protein
MADGAIDLGSELWKRTMLHSKAKGTPHLVCLSAAIPVAVKLGCFHSRHVSKLPCRVSCRGPSNHCCMRSALVSNGALVSHIRAFSLACMHLIPSSVLRPGARALNPRLSSKAIACSLCSCVCASRKLVELHSTGTFSGRQFSMAKKGAKKAAAEAPEAHKAMKAMKARKA